VADLEPLSFGGRPGREAFGGLGDDVRQIEWFLLHRELAGAAAVRATTATPTGRVAIVASGRKMVDRPLHYPNGA
jgi:hypothetical protein